MSHVAEGVACDSALRHMRQKMSHMRQLLFKKEGAACAAPNNPAWPGGVSESDLQAFRCGLRSIPMPSGGDSIGLRVLVSGPILGPGLPGINVVQPGPAAQDDFQYSGCRKVGKHIFILFKFFVVGQWSTFLPSIARCFINSRPGLGCFSGCAQRVLWSPRKSSLFHRG